jgi:D-glycero-D-manno-heptose 1,7-bisphosphate phosphatase
MPEKPFAVFMDRDGTVCEEVGYVNHPSRCHIFAFSAKAIRAINQAGAKAVIISNQAGVARGYFPESLVLEVNQKIARGLKAKGARLDAIYFCPHHPDVGEPPYRLDCQCRKPRRGMLDRAVSELGVDLSRSYIIGDRKSDIEMAGLHGLRSALVLTGYGRGEFEYHLPEWEYQPDWVCSNLFQAVRKILLHSRGELHS